MGVLLARKSPVRVSLPRFHFRVGLHIDLFEVCSAFTRVAACTLTRSPKFVTAIRGLQTFRRLHACPGCFRLERWPGGPCTHWKTPPCHGARGVLSFGQIGALASPAVFSLLLKLTAGYSASWMVCAVRAVLLGVNMLRQGKPVQQANAL
jgi:hypothetical protein